MYWLALVWLLFLVACKPDPPDHQAMCLAGEAEACVKACRQGAYGKSGCLAAARGKNPLRKTEMYSRACQGGVPEACAPAAEASITLSMSNPRQYRGLLERGCQLQDRRACQLLGDFLLEDTLEQAKEAYTRACQLPGANTEHCGPKLDEFMERLKRDRADCDRNEPAACERLLHQLAVRNHDAGYHAAERLCSIRGLSDYYAKSRMSFAYKLRKRRREYHGCGLFLLARAASDPEQKSAFRRVELPFEATPDHGGRLELTSVTLHFRDQTSANPEQLLAIKTQVQSEIEKRLALASRCYNQRLAKDPSLRGEIVASFIVDKLGEPLELRDASHLSDLSLRSCVVSAAIAQKFAFNEPLASVVRVEATLSLSAADSRLQ